MCVSVRFDFHGCNFLISLWYINYQPEFLGLLSWGFTPNPKTTLLSWWLRLRSRSPPKKRSASLVGDFNPSEKYAHQIGSFPQVGRNIKIFKTTNQLSMLSTVPYTLLACRIIGPINYFFFPSSQPQDPPQKVLATRTPLLPPGGTPAGHPVYFGKFYLSPVLNHRKVH